MRISLDHLRTFISTLPQNPVEAVALLDDVGIEVKRHDTEHGQTIATVELLANRGDHHCYRGIAREVYARTGAGLCNFSDPSVNSVAQSKAKKFSIETDLCYAYALTPFKVGTGKLPASTSTLLEISGVSLTHPFVDLSNLLLLEHGQPTHAFDADKIQGSIQIRLSRPGEQAQPLFSEQERELPSETLVIADSAGVIAIAGVIGCERAKVDSSTTNILLESALFDPISVRKASRALQIQSDAAQRFERGTDPELVLGGIAILENNATTWKIAQRVGPTEYALKRELPARSIPLSLERVNTYLASSLKETEVVDRLSRYGFACSQSGQAGSWNVEVPSHRKWDVENPACLFEELAKSIGYNNFPETLPTNLVGASPTAQEALERSVSDVLVSAGFYETITDGFYGKAQLARFLDSDDDPFSGHVETINSLDKSFSFLKNNGLLQALESVERAFRHGFSDVKFFEWTRIFHPSDSTFCEEKPILWGAVSGNSGLGSWNSQHIPFDIWTLKGIVEEIARLVSGNLRLVAGPSKALLAAKLHPTVQGHIVDSAGKLHGIFGAVHPRLEKLFKLPKSGIYYFEFYLDGNKQVGADEQIIDDFDVPAGPRRNLSFHVPRGIEAQSIIDAMTTNDPALKTQVSMEDAFFQDEVRSLTFQIQFFSSQLSVEAMNAAVEDAAERVISAFGSRGVVRR